MTIDNPTKKGIMIHQRMLEKAVNRIVKIRISNKIKKIIVTMLKLPVAYKNKGGKIVKINVKSVVKIILATIFLDSSLEISHVIIIDAIIAQSKADTTIVNLLRPSITYENKGGKIEDSRTAKIRATIVVINSSFVNM
ncbi:6865_t:CDS:1 [Diversispora eburnea]|uniref:6865_t:CDS:1 n=1 Tax=Diversispora eburnea TaxID=1213867 RepID=A0A9N8V4X9_9GLOM|nr:6865_t:CDS:1 [Diversispora eburnea]